MALHLFHNLLPVFLFPCFLWHSTLDGTFSKIFDGFPISCKRAWDHDLIHSIHSTNISWVPALGIWDTSKNRSKLQFHLVWTCFFLILTLPVPNITVRDHSTHIYISSSILVHLYIQKATIMCWIQQWPDTGSLFCSSHLWPSLTCPL